jgi:hypothetical protein
MIFFKTCRSTSNLLHPGINICFLLIPTIFIGNTIIWVGRIINAAILRNTENAWTFQIFIKPRKYNLALSIISFCNFATQYLVTMIVFKAIKYNLAPNLISFFNFCTLFLSTAIILFKWASFFKSFLMVLQFSLTSQRMNKERNLSFFRLVIFSFYKIKANRRFRVRRSASYGFTLTKITIPTDLHNWSCFSILNGVL